jgi:hypothetical protein
VCIVRSDSCLIAQWRPLSKPVSTGIEFRCDGKDLNAELEERARIDIAGAWKEPTGRGSPDGGNLVFY